MHSTEEWYEGENRRRLFQKHLVGSNVKLCLLLSHLIPKDLILDLLPVADETLVTLVRMDLWTSLFPWTHKSAKACDPVPSQGCRARPDLTKYPCFLFSFLFVSTLQLSKSLSHQVTFIVWDSASCPVIPPCPQGQSLPDLAIHSHDHSPEKLPTWTS